MLRPGFVKEKGGQGPQCLRDEGVDIADLLKEGTDTHRRWMEQLDLIAEEQRMTKCSPPNRKRQEVFLDCLGFSAYG